MPKLLAAVPVVLIVLAVPLILGAVPRNHWYGFRTPYTLSSDAVWLQANRIAGATLALAGMAWGLLYWFAPHLGVQNPQAVVLFGGLGAILVALLASFVLVYRTSA